MVEETIFSISATRMKLLIDRIKYLDELEIKFDSDLQKMKDEALTKYRENVSWMRKYLSDIEESLNRYEEVKG